MAILLVEGGKNKGESLALPAQGTVTIGREQRCDLRIADVMASRRHFEVRATPSGRYAIRDLRSSNGTFVNGQRLAPEEERPLEIEDKIQVGSTLISLVGEGAKEAKGELTGRTIGGYHVEERIGRGAMGTVYKAQQLSLERTVALKILARELAGDPRRVEMFQSEARAAGKLNHPNIVQVYDVGEDQGLYYFSAEYMAGGTVEEKIHARGRLSVAETLRIAIDATRGLEYAERQGIIHRDIKPANLLVNAEGVTKIGDLGIARRANPRDADLALEEAQGIAGSPLYMAPEQAKGEPPLDHRADLYALGATLYHALAGEPPFQGSSPREVILQHLNEAPRPLGEIDPAIPPEVAGLIERLLAKDRDRRPASATTLLEELRALDARFGAGASVAAVGGRPRTRRAAILLASAAAAVLCGGAGGVYAYVKAKERRAEKEREERRALEAAEREAERRSAAAAAAAEARRFEEEARKLAAREREAVAAIDEADAYLRDHADDDLDGVLARYRAVAETYAGTAVEARARAQVEKIEPLARSMAEARAAREAREAAAKKALDAIADAIDVTPPEQLAALRDRLEAAWLAHAGTEAIARAPDIRRAIMAKLDRSRQAVEDDMKKALEARDPAAARGGLDKVLAWNVSELKPWADSWRSRIAQAERDAAAAQAAAQRAALERELEAVRKTDDRVALRAFEHAAVKEALAALALTLATEEARALARARIFTLDCELRALAALRAHVNEGKRPEIEFPLAGYQGVARSADGGGITFVARDRPGVEVRRSFASFSGADFQRFFAAVALEPEDLEAYALGSILLDIGDDERARRELGKALRDARPEMKPWIERALSEARERP